MPTKSAMIAKIVSECIATGWIDEIILELFKASMSEKSTLKSQNQWRGASLKAIGKIADGTGDIEAVKALCEENET